jgi:exodeoxyribonuclease VII small subunit
MAARKKTFEESMLRLEEIVARLEKGEATLEESMKLFEEGTRLSAACARELDAAEQKVMKLTKGADGAPLASPMEE